MNKAITSDDILGKEAVDSEGDILGVVMKLHIDKQNKLLTGITIDQGFLKPDLFVGIQYIQNFGVDTVFLNYIPHHKFKGLHVRSFDGHELGTVRDIQMDGNKLVSLTFGHNSKDLTQAPISQIKEIGAGVILKQQK